MKKSLMLATLCLGAMLSSTANARDKAPQMTDYGYKVDAIVDGYHIDQCSPDLEGNIDMCSRTMVNKVKEIAKYPANFGKNSVLFRFWDSGLNYWVYGAVNKQTKNIFVYPRGLRAMQGNLKDVKITLGKNRDRICTAGDGVMIEGTQYSKSYDDTSNEVDYCTPYSDSEGFGQTLEVDSKTRKVIQEVWY
ncbi:hypothetical protein [Psychrobacter sp. I-STPA6b]|uniref:hypothetical protein n=1 Tax=Psychrobacter sp. I-STPA6b TaxID=2585718 RepID=UPI001D0CCBD8|nr:hypothetical protein [Psychrobacter sp. I-STPA6b]